MNNTVNVVFSIEKVASIHEAIVNYISDMTDNFKANMSKQQAREIIDMNNIKNKFDKKVLQSKYGFINTNLSERDCIAISVAIKDLWNKHTKYLMPKENDTQKAANFIFMMRKTVLSVLNTATSVYASLCPNIRKGNAFRSLYYVPVSKAY